MHTKRLSLLGLVLLILLFISCNSEQSFRSPSSGVKYVFLFIGDGMGTNHALITDLYLKSQGKPGLRFMQFPTVVLTNTSCATKDKITDSGAGGTAIATGHKTEFHSIGMNPKTGEQFRSIAEIAHANGWRVGIITSVGLNHATPASFYAHVESRKSYGKIVAQLARSGFDFFAGGSFATEYEGLKDLRLHRERVKEFFNIISAAGYKVVLNKENFENAVSEAKDSAGAKLFLTDTASLTYSAMYYMIDSLSRVSLSDYTRLAIDFLQNDSTGFFIMVEGGKIDWASHNNDVATMMYEVMDFDRAIAVALDFYKKHPNETIIIVTADHETGGLSLGNSHKHYDYDLQQLSAQWRSKQFLIDSMNSSANYNAAWIHKYIHAKYSCPSDLTKPVEQVECLLDSLQRDAGINWATRYHTGTFIPTYVMGVGSDLYQGIIDNTYTFKVLLRVTGLSENKK